MASKNIVTSFGKKRRTWTFKITDADGKAIALSAGTGFETEAQAERTARDLMHDEQTFNHVRTLQARVRARDGEIRKTRTFAGIACLIVIGFGLLWALL